VLMLVDVEQCLEAIADSGQVERVSKDLEG
jgi:hypothetical protein